MRDCENALRSAWFMPKRREDRDGTRTLTRPEVESETASDRKLERPPLYDVLLHNDDYTSMEFVVAILREVFHHNEVDATRIMLHVHQNGMGVAGVYTHEVAETRVRRTLALAKEAQFPLMCSMEPEE